MIIIVNFFIYIKIINLFFSCIRNLELTYVEINQILNLVFLDIINCKNKLQVFYIFSIINSYNDTKLYIVSYLIY